MRYLEVGTLGVQTEVEAEWGEVRLNGLFPKGKVKSIYVRLRLGRRQFIVDTLDGVKVQSKEASHWRLVLGVRMF